MEEDKVIGRGVWVGSVALLSTVLFAQSQAPTQNQTQCKECSRPPDKLTDPQLQILANFSTILDDKLTDACKNDPTGHECAAVSWAQGRFEKHPACASYFVDKNGNLGKLSKIIMKQIADDVVKNKENSVYLQNSPDIEQYCHGFSKMSPILKIGWHAWHFEITGYFETTCGAQLTNRSPKVPNGPAVCLYQLELAQSLRSWRGPHCKAASAADMQNPNKPEVCTACALDEYARELRTNTLFGVRDPKTDKLTVKSYWASHNPLPKIPAAQHDNPKLPANEIQRWLGYYPYCKQTPATQQAALNLDF